MTRCRPKRYGRKQEVLNLQRQHLDLQASTLRLDPGKTKNREGRVAHLTPEMKAALSAQVDRLTTRARPRCCGYVVTEVEQELAKALLALVARLPQRQLHQWG